MVTAGGGPLLPSRSSRPRGRQLQGARDEEAWLLRWLWLGKGAGDDFHTRTDSVRRCIFLALGLKRGEGCPVRFIRQKNFANGLTYLRHIHKFSLTTIDR